MTLTETPTITRTRATVDLKHTHPDNRCAMVAARLRNPLQALRLSVCPETFMLYMKLSRRECGILVGDHHPNGHQGRAFTKGHMARLASGDRPITADVADAFGTTGEKILWAASGGKVCAEFLGGARKWKWRIRAECTVCQRPFEPESIRGGKCKRCLSKGARK